MKTVLALGIAFIGLAPLHGRAQEAGKRLEEVVRKRDALLVQFVERAERTLKAGSGTEEDFRDATVKLWSFRRDTAKEPAERLKWQKQIVAFETERLAKIKKRIEAGVMKELDALRAEEQLLEAEQKLLELQLAK